MEDESRERRRVTMGKYYTGGQSDAVEHQEIARNLRGYASSNTGRASILSLLALYLFTGRD